MNVGIFIYLDAKRNKKFRVKCFKEKCANIITLECTEYQALSPDMSITILPVNNKSVSKNDFFKFRLNIWKLIFRKYCFFFLQRMSFSDMRITILMLIMKSELENIYFFAKSV